MKKFIFASLIIALFLFCEKSVTPPPEPPPPEPVFTTTLTGQVLLENQGEHSNALIYLDSLNLGARSDSSGQFRLTIPDNFRWATDVFKVYYFVEDYDLDSAFIKLVEGRVQTDTLDADSSGALPLKNMNQILQVEGWTDRQEYRIGDTLHLQVIMRDISDRKLVLFIGGVFNDFGVVYLSRKPTQDSPHVSYSLTSTTIATTLNVHIDLLPTGFYDGNASYPIPEGDFIDPFFPLDPDDYTVVAPFEFLDRGYPVPQQIRDYIFENWFNDPESGDLYLDSIPNKYKYPQITIIP